MTGRKIHEANQSRRPWVGPEWAARAHRPRSRGCTETRTGPLSPQSPQMLTTANTSAWLALKTTGGLQLCSPGTSYLQPSPRGVPDPHPPSLLSKRRNKAHQQACGAPAEGTKPDRTSWGGALCLPRTGYLSTSASWRRVWVGHVNVNILHTSYKLCTAVSANLNCILIPIPPMPE